MNDGSTQAAERQGGAPFAGEAGFIGPVEGFVGAGTDVTAHSGMECGALHSPKIEAFGPRGLGGTGFDPRFICPALDVEDE